jgi:hypothetical protein
MLSGILMVLTLPNTAGACIVSRGSSREFLYPGMTRGWIIEYTVWNWTFVFLNFPIIAGQQLSVLAAALIIGLIEPKRWPQARGHTLAASLLLLFTYPELIIRCFDTTLWHTPQREVVASLLCMMVAIMSSRPWAMDRLTSLNRVLRLEHSPLARKSQGMGTNSS